MKILDVSTGSFNHTAYWVRILGIANGLIKREHDVDIIQYISKEEYKNQINSTFNLNFGDVSIETIVTSRPMIPIHHLKKMIFNKKYDLVHANTQVGTFYSILGKLTGTPLVFDMHGGSVEEFLLLNNNFNIEKNLKLSLLKFIEYLALHFSDKIICVSKKMINYFHENKNVPRDKMHYITNGVDLEFFKPITKEKIEIMKEKLSINDKFIFGYIGGSQKWQGVENLIKVSERIDDTDIFFLFIGADKNEKRTHNSLFIPKVSYTEIPSYYSLCDVLVLPRPSHSATEIAAPTKFAEYTAMSKPILTTNVGDAANFVRENRCGIVVSDNSIENLKKGILEFKDKSPEELRIMSKNSRKLAETEFNWNKIVDRYINSVINS